MKIGIIREGKMPPDSRTPLTPAQCALIHRDFGIEIVIQSSPHRCFKDIEYVAEGIEIQEDLSDCDALLGVKEIPTPQLIPDKAYFIFSHTIKKQARNRKLLQEILERHITLIDYETLTNEKGERLIAFGKFAGMVGAHNALWTYGKRSGYFDMKRMYECHDYAEAKEIYKTMNWPSVKIVVTGTGRVANGIVEVLNDMGIKRVSPHDFLKKRNIKAVYTQLGSADYVVRKDGQPYSREDFHQHPHLYKSAFQPYLSTSDILINGIFWNNQAPAFFTLKDMSSPAFQISVIADVTCDIAPDSSIPCTIRASTIAQPVYGYDPHLLGETAPYQPGSVDVMAIDNLPNEMPRDASTAFGQQFIDNILQEFIHGKESKVIQRATIAREGHLMPPYEYLRDYVENKEPISITS
jgi:saccharopine dehydrogenase (NAD+, L-lysine-forming)